MYPQKKKKVWVSRYANTLKYCLANIKQYKKYILDKVKDVQENYIKPFLV